MSTPAWSRYPFVSAEPQARPWLGLIDNLGRSPANLDAYGRGLNQYLAFCRACDVIATDATLEHVSLFVRYLRGELAGSLPLRSAVSNATLQQRFTAVRLWYDHVVYQGLRERNPVPRGHLLPVNGRSGNHAGFSYGLVRRLTLLPRIPTEPDWLRVLAEVSREACGTVSCSHLRTTVRCGARS